MIIDVAICDDNRSEREQCGRDIWLAARKEGIEINTYEYRDARSLCRDIRKEYVWPHILYLDTELPDAEGIETAERLRDIRYDGKIIFWADSRARVFDAFDVDAFNFIVKGQCSRERFEEIFYQAVCCVTEASGKQIELACGAETVRIPLKDIRYFTVNGRHISVYFNDRRFDFNSTMARLEEQLVRQDFVRISRKALVNISAVRVVRSREIELDDKTILTIGASYYGEFRASVRKWAVCRRDILKDSALSIRIEESG